MEEIQSGGDMIPHRTNVFFLDFAILRKFCHFRGYSSGNPAKLCYCSLITDSVKSKTLNHFKKEVRNKRKNGVWFAKRNFSTRILL